MAKKKPQSVADKIKELTQSVHLPAVVESVANTTQTQRTEKKLGGITGKGFMPGQSGNPAGPKPGYHHAKTYALKVIKEMAKTTDGKEMEVGEAMVRSMVKESLKGNTTAFNTIFDRVDGKAPQPHIGDDGEDPIRFNIGIDKMLEKGYADEE